MGEEENCDEVDGSLELLSSSQHLTVAFVNAP